MKPNTHYVQIIESDGTNTGATFAVEKVEGAKTIRFDSRGTTAGTHAYRRGMVLLLQRLSYAGITIEEIAIETKTTRHLSRAQRSLQLPEATRFPLQPKAYSEDNAEALRAMIHTAAARAGRAPGAKGGGNGTKRLRIYLKTRMADDKIERCVSLG